LRLVKLTGWGFSHILEELPFAVGLQLLQADDYTNGIHRPWSRDNAAVDIDAFASIETTLAKYGKV
jgi:hypothetical protein